METVSNVVSSASKMIWGESNAGEEPVNGQTGAGNVSEPYDKGNDVGKFPRDLPALFATVLFLHCLRTSECFARHVLREARHLGDKYFLV
jgi:hypothetical protein